MTAQRLARERRSCDSSCSILLIAIVPVEGLMAFCWYLSRGGGFREREGRAQDISGSQCLLGCLRYILPVHNFCWAGSMLCLAEGILM